MKISDFASGLRMKTMKFAVAFLAVSAMFFGTAQAQDMTLDEDSAAAFVEELIADMEAAVGDEDYINEIIEKWEARDLVGKTKSQAIAMLAADVRAVTDDATIANGLRLKWNAKLRGSASAAKPQTAPKPNNAGTISSPAAPGQVINAQPNQTISVGPPPTSGNMTTGTLVVNPNPVGPGPDIKVTGYVPGFPTGSFNPGEVVNGKLLCPITNGKRLVLGCTTWMGNAPAWASRTSGNATRRGKAVNGKCDGFSRVAGQGYAFHDPRNGGECWSCPVLMHRTMHPVTSQDPSFPACTTGNDDGILWQSAQYPEPGLAAFINSAIVRLAFKDGAYVDAFLNKRAGGDAFTKQRLWDRMINAPNESPELKALIFSAILLTAQRDQNLKTDASQTVLIFQDYIRKRRTYLAKDASAMYERYLDFNSYKQQQALRSVMMAGGPLGFVSGGSGAVITSPQAGLGATVGVPPDDYVNAAYSAAVPDKRGEEFIRAFEDLTRTSYQPTTIKNDSGFDPSASIQLGLNTIDSATAIHDLLVETKVIKGLDMLSSKGAGIFGLAVSLGGSVLDAVAAAMTVHAQEEADKQYRELVSLADQPVSIAEILEGGTAEEKNELIMWWALATSPYKPSGAFREFPVQNSEVCAKYSSQCAEIKRIITAVKPKPTSTPRPSAPPELVEQAGAASHLSRLLAVVNDPIMAGTLKNDIAQAVRRFNEAAAAVRNLSGDARAAADLFTPELLTPETARLRRELNRVRGVPGVYPVLQSALAQLDRVASQRQMGLDQ